MTKDWAPLQEDVRELYHVKNMRLEEVMRLIRGRHNFIASSSLDATHRNVVSAVYEEALMRGGTTAPVATEYGVFDQSLDSGMEFAFGTSHLDPEGKTPLHHAIIRKDLEQVRHLLSTGTAVDIKDFTGSGPLHYGVLTANSGLVQLILRYGAEVNAKGPLGRTALHLAASISNLEIVATLLGTSSKVSELDDNGDSPLHIASRVSTYKDTTDVSGLVTRLLKAGADVNLANKNGMTAFHTLLDQPFSTTYDASSSTPRSQVTALILTFIDHGADVKALFPDGRLPLHVFLERSAMGWTRSQASPKWPHRAVDNNDSQIMMQLLEKYEQSDFSMQSGESLAHYYIRESWDTWTPARPWATKLCQLAEPHQLPRNGNSLLHELMLKPQPATESLVADLLRRGWDPVHRNEHGDTPLHLLVRVKETPRSRPIIRKLLSTMSTSKANLWLRNDEDTMLLSQVAARYLYTSPGFVKTLLSLDIDREDYSTDAWTGWESARKATTFRDALSYVDVDKSTLPPGFYEGILKEAHAALAEKHLEAIEFKRLADDPGNEPHYRASMADILRLCRAHDITVDMRFYDKLLALC